MISPRWAVPTGLGVPNSLRSATYPLLAAARKPHEAKGLGVIAPDLSRFADTRVTRRGHDRMAVNNGKIYGSEARNDAGFASDRQQLRGERMGGPMSHVDGEYRQHLRAMRCTALEMAGLVEDMISNSVTALLTKDQLRARQVISKDLRVDQLELTLDDLGTTTLARWHPMASDLRFVILTLKMVRDLERIGDLAVNISERALDLAGQQPAIEFRHIDEMGQIACTMLRNAIDALLEEEPDKARAVIDQDDELDAIYNRAFNEILGRMISSGTPNETRMGVHGLAVAKWLERAGDHATNVAEHVIFLVDGRDVRHIRDNRERGTP